MSKRTSRHQARAASHSDSIIDQSPPRSPDTESADDFSKLSISAYDFIIANQINRGRGGTRCISDVFFSIPANLIDERESLIKVARVYCTKTSPACAYMHCFDFMIYTDEELCIVSIIIMFYILIRTRY